MPFPDSVDDKLDIQGLHLRTNRDYILEGVNGAIIDLRGDVRNNGVDVITDDELDEALFGGVALYNNTAYDTIQEAINAAAASVGGQIIVRPGSYAQQLDLTVAERIELIGYGVTLTASANSQTIVNIDRGPDVKTSIRLKGFKIDGAGFTGITGVQLIDTIGGSLEDVYIEDCNVGLRFAVVSAYTESSGADRVFVRNCATGILYDDQGAGSASFLQCWLNNVFVTECIVGITQQNAAQFARVHWTNVSVWLHVDNSVGVRFTGQLDMCHLSFGVESFVVGPVNTVGVHATSTLSFWVDANTTDIQANFIGSFSRQFKNDSATPLVIKDGPKAVVTNSGIALSARNENQTYARMVLGTAGFLLGPGDADATAYLRCDFSNWVSMNGWWFVEGVMGLVETTPPSGVVERAILFSKDNGAGKTQLYVQFPTGTAQLLGQQDNLGIFENGSVSNAMLATDAVTQVKIANDAVGTAEIINLAVDNAKLAVDAVTQVKIANDAVGTAEIIDANVTYAKLANDAKYRTLNTQTGTTYTLVLADANNKYIRCTNAGGCTVTVPANSTVAYPVGTVIRGVSTPGSTTLAAAGGVTINNVGGLVMTVMVGWQITKVATDAWDLAKL